MAQGLFAAIALALALALPAQAEALPEIRPPKWVDLSPRQKQVLTPLESQWDSLADAGRKKWLGIANRYSRMSAEEQVRVQTRMKQWAELTPEQRQDARERYRRLLSISPSQRETLKEKWAEYEKLPDAEKRRLKESAIPGVENRSKMTRGYIAKGAEKRRSGLRPLATPSAPSQGGLPTAPAPPKDTQAGSVTTETGNLVPHPVPHPAEGATSDTNR